MKHILFALSTILLMGLISCKNEKKIVHVEGRDQNGHPEHFFSYYLNEKGQQVFDGVETEWWSPDRKRLETHWEDGRKNGMFSRWYPNGNLESQEYYQNDTIDSVTITYFENGQKKTESNYKNKKLDGLDRTWDSTGQLLELMTYKDGRLEGPWIIWYLNGQKQREQTAVNGELEGISRWWDEKGRLGAETFLVHGKEEGPQKTWYANGNIQSKFSALANRRHEGTDSSWYESGELEYSGFWKNDQKEGYMVHWDKQGHKLDETIVVDGKAKTKKYDKGGMK